jgi:hypothetical protein
VNVNCVCCQSRLHTKPGSGALIEEMALLKALREG